MILSEQSKRRYEAFWNRSDTDRACAFLNTWKSPASFRAPADVRHQWEDIPERVERALFDIGNQQYFAEGFPSVFTNFGPGCLAACVGGSYRPAKDTVWFENRPFFVSDWDKAAPILAPESRMYRLIDEFTESLLLHKDKLCVSLTDIGGTYDIIASLRGTQNLLCDLYDCPEDVKRFRNKLAPIWKAFFLACSKRLIAAQGGYSTWMPIWSDRSYYPLQCDFSAMISPRMFGEFILPDLKEQTELMDRAIYHLDGPGELPHVDQLLSLPRLNAIQWTSGDGNPPVWDQCWFDLYHRIQSAGKGIVLLGVVPDKLEALLKNVSQRGLFISAYVGSETEANELCDMMVKLNR